jgi:hypothetical protein
MADQWQRDLIKAVGDDVVRDLVADFRRERPIPRPLVEDEAQMQRTNGWIEARPLRAGGDLGWASMTKAEIEEREKRWKERRDGERGQT